MKAKLTPAACYMAGLMSKSRNESNMIGIISGVHELEEKFVAIAVKEFEIPPNKILFEEIDGKRHTYFYHSRIAKRLAEIISKENKLFKVNNVYSSNYMAGMFDVAGRFGNQTMYIGNLTPADDVMFANLGVHTRGGNIMNISTFVAAIKGYSVIIAQSKFG